MIKVGIIEEDNLLLKNLNIFLGNFPDLQIVFSFPDFFEFERIWKKEKVLTPEIILIDYSEPADRQKLNLLSRLLEIFPSAKLLVYTEFDDEDMVVESITKGASGYLLKSNTLFDIYSAIKECSVNGGFISTKAVLQIINYMHHKQPTVALQDDMNMRQRQIINCLQQGLTYEDISKQLGITKFTVNYHVQRIFRKMMVKSRTELIYKMNSTEQSLGKQ